MFICPKCNHESLDIKLRRDLGRSGDWDEIEFQLVKCNDCDLCAFAAYLEERHGSSDYWRHEGIVVTQKTWEKVKAKLNINPWFFWQNSAWLVETGGNVRLVAEKFSEDFDSDKVEWFKLRTVPKQFPVRE